jgi:signal transduction histidine kinase
MAHGNFMGNMPASMRQDEIGQLQNIFGNMQMSIVEYIENLRVKNEELLQANERAMVAESMKTAFLQNMTHQIRTPLNHVTGFAQVIQSGYKNIPEDEMKLMIDGMIQGTQTITVILNQLIDISELDSNLKIEKSDEVNPTDLCLEAIQLIKPKHPETVKLDVESDIPDDFRMHTNRMWMLKVFHALLDNSNKFTKEGSIIISCHKKNDKYIEFAVTDTGCGIPKEQRENIFTKFVKLDEFADGIGIGLSLCRNITQLLGGDIVLDMDFKNGSRFVVTLPVD